MENNEQFKILDDQDNKEFFLKQELTLLGRGDGNNWIFEGNGVSEYHAAILFKRKKAYIVDLVSSNGTYIDGKRISTPVELIHNAIIKLDEYQLRFIDTEMRSETILRESPSSSAGQGNLSQEEISKLPRIMYNNKENVGKSNNFEVLTGESTSVGRDETCDIVIAEQSVSKKHFLIRRDGTICYLNNLSKSNGTMINNKTIGSEVKLYSGDIILAGRISFTFISSSDGKTEIAGSGKTHLLDDMNNATKKDVEDPNETVVMDEENETKTQAQEENKTVNDSYSKTQISE
jgi:pSer/pThr/pTyr-binding forkhead associated (FHA) protein